MGRKSDKDVKIVWDSKAIKRAVWSVCHDDIEATTAEVASRVRSNVPTMNVDHMMTINEQGFPAGMVRVADAMAVETEIESGAISSAPLGLGLEVKRYGLHRNG